MTNQHDEREAIARIAEWRRQLEWREFEAARDGLTEEGKTGLYWIRLFVKDLDAILAMQAERRADNTVQRDRIYRAAERSNTRFGQWMPERWVNIFVEELNK